MLQQFCRLLLHPVAREVIGVLAAVSAATAVFASGKLGPRPPHSFPFAIASLAFFAYSLLPLNISPLSYRPWSSYQAKARALIQEQEESNPPSWAELTRDCQATQERYVVVGGAGFVGQRLVHALVLRGERHVLVVDMDHHAMLAMQREYPSVSFVRADVTNRKEVFRALEGAQCVYAPFAAIRFWESLQRHLPLSARVNIDGLRNVCDACVEHGVHRLVFTATSAVCETFPSIVPEGIDETTPTVTSASTYTSNYCVTKAEGERLALDYYNQHGLRVASIRPCTAVFGYGDKLAMANLHRGFYPVIDPSNVLDFVHLDSVVLAHLLCERALRGDDGDTRWKEVAGQAFCVATEAAEEGVFAALVEHYYNAEMTTETTHKKKHKRIVAVLPGRLIFILSAVMSLLQWALAPVVDLQRVVGRDLGTLTLPTFLTATKRLLLLTGKSDKSARLLGYRPHKPLALAVKQTLQEFHQRRVIIE